MSTSVTVADWIKRIADDERRRDTERVKVGELAARKADLVRRNGQRLIDEVRASVTRDVLAFRDEFAGGVAWNDPAFGIEWPFEPTVISERDRTWPRFNG